VQYSAELEINRSHVCFTSTADSGRKMLYYSHNISGINYHYLLYRVAQKVSQQRIIKKSLETFQLHYIFYQIKVPIKCQPKTI